METAAILLITLVQEVIKKANFLNIVESFIR